MEKSKFSESELNILYRRFHAAKFYTTQAKRRQAQRAAAHHGKVGASAQPPLATSAAGAEPEKEGVEFLLFYNFLVRLSRCACAPVKCAHASHCAPGLCARVCVCVSEGLSWAPLNPTSVRYEDTWTDLHRRMKETPHADFLWYLFRFCDRGHGAPLSFEHAVLGLERLATGDLLSRMDAFFAMHADGADVLTREQYVGCTPTHGRGTPAWCMSKWPRCGCVVGRRILRVSQSLLYLFRNDGETRQVLSGAAVSQFLNLAFQVCVCACPNLTMAIQFFNAAWGVGPGPGRPERHAQLSRQRAARQA
jgi:hypothetical protein